MQVASRRRIGPVCGGDRVGVGVGATRKHVRDQLLPVDRLHQREPHLGVAEESLAVSIRVEGHERVGEQPRLVHGQVGAAQQGLHLLRLDPADQVGRARKDRADRELRVRCRVSPHDEVIQVGLRRRVRIAVERDGQLIDRAHLEGSGAERSHTAVRAGHDLRRRHALEDVLRDDADPERQREGRFGGPQGEHHLAPPSGGHADLPPSVSARLLVLDVLQDMKREQDVVGAEGLTVRPLHALPHIERVAQVVRGHAPARREDADDVLLGVDRGQALVDHAVDVARALVGLEQGVEHRRLADQRLDCRAALCGLRHRRDRLASGDCQHRREGGGREATRDALPPRRWRPSRPGMRPR